MSGAAATGPLLERSEELARIESALEAARAGRGTSVVVEGPPGIGKTALLAAAQTVAAGSGMRVLRSRGAELERDFAFGVVRQLFEPALAEASPAERTELLQSAAGVAAGLLGLPGGSTPDGPPASGVDPAFAILHGLYWLCANLAAEDALCLVVDDAHWADVPSLRYLAFLLTRLDELHVGLIVATRLRDPGTDAELLAAVTAAPSAEAISLPPLTRAGVAELVESALEGPPDPAFVDACMRATGGTPFLVRELVGALAAAGVAPTAGAAGSVEEIGAGTVGRSIELRLRRLPDPARRLARALAVLERSDLVHAARLAGLDEAAAAAAAEQLANAGIVDPGLPLAFVHPIVRSALYSSLSGAERAHAHREAAHVLFDFPGAQERVAQHLLASEPAGDGWVVDRLVASAQAARQQGAPELEAVYLRRAVAEPPAVGRQGELLLDLGVAEASAGIEGWNEHLQRAVEAAPDPAAAIRPASALAHTLNRAQRCSEAVDVLDRATAALGPSDSELALQLEAAAVIIGMNDFVVAASVAARRRAVRDRARADPAAPPDVLAAAAFISVLTNEPARAGAELALLAGRRVAAGAERQPVTTSFGFFARVTLSLLWAERYSELEPLLDASIAHARATADSGLLAVGLANRAWLALRHGDLSAAEADTRTALAATVLPAPPMYRLLNGALLAETLLERADLDEADDELGRLGSEVERGSLIGAMVRFARGRLRAEQGRVDDALEDFLAVGAGLTQVEVLCPGYLPWRSEAAIAQLALGDRERAVRLAAEELELARTFGAPRALGVAMRAAGIAAGSDEGEHLLRDAAATLQRADARLERARTLADLGAMLRRRNQRTQARALLREALDAAHRSGAARLAQRAETELRATGARPRRLLLTGLESLTASERRIAELASQELTNREIAQQLFITDRTVESHLTSVFRKLELDSRSELPAALAERDPVSA